MQLPVSPTKTSGAQNIYILLLVILTPLLSNIDTHRDGRMVEITS